MSTCLMTFLLTQAEDGFRFFQGGPGCCLGPDSRFKIEAKLRFGTTASLWLASDLRYVPRTLQVQQFGNLHCCHV